MLFTLGPGSDILSGQCRPVCVLVVDDDCAVRSSFVRVLRHDGYDVLTAGSGTEALRMVTERQPDVVVSDIAMPGVDGVAFLRAVRSLHPDIPVIFATGVPTLDSAIEAIEGHVDAYLRKPVAPWALRLAVRRAEHRSRQRSFDSQLSALCAPPEQGTTPADTWVVAPAEGDIFERALNSIRLDYQPIVRSRDGEIHGYEALLRSEWMSPPELVELASRVGQIHRLGRRVRKMAAARFVAEPSDALLFINLHPHDLSDDELLDPDSILSKIASRVVLEVTEYASLEGIPQLQSRLSSLRALGFRIALDDLGDRHANLGAITLLEPDLIKLSMSLVRNIHRERTKRALVGSLVGAARELGAEIVAEGVESDQELEVLIRLGVDFLQGYLFARPSDDLRPSSIPPALGGQWGRMSAPAVPSHFEGLENV